MATTDATTSTGYRLDGSLLEICSCGTPCPCFIGEDPDGGECYGVVAFHLDDGEIEGIDVSGLTVVNVAHIPGNALQGNWRVVLLINDTATDEQQDALLRAFGGELGGPLADLAGLVGEVVEVRRVPIHHAVDRAAGTLDIDGIVDAEVAPITAAPDGSATTLYGSAFSTVPDAPAYVGKSRRYAVDLPEHDLAWSFEGRNSIQTAWRMEHRP